MTSMTTPADTKPRRVLLATPSYDGRIDVWYANSLVGTLALAAGAGVEVSPVWMSYDALIQRSRNDLIALAVAKDFDDIVWIDSDMAWEPQWFMELLDSPRDVVGGTTRKKTDHEEVYPVKTRSLALEDDGTIAVESIGTGFVRTSRRAFLAAWDASRPYRDRGRAGERRMVFEVVVGPEGDLVSEDVAFMGKMRAAGFQPHLMPHMTCLHVGPKVFEGDFMRYRERVIESWGGDRDPARS